MVLGPKVAWGSHVLHIMSRELNGKMVVRETTLAVVVGFDLSLLVEKVESFLL